MFVAPSRAASVTNTLWIGIPVGAVSFISEHTAEYVLVPTLARILSAAFSRVVPVYFWLTREGNTIAQRCMSGQSVRLIAVYPRRPKIEDPGQNHILVKVNAQLFEFARRAAPLGIPVFAGVPLASSLTDLALDLHSGWLRLTPQGTDDRDIEFGLTLEGTKLGKEPRCADLEGPLQPAQLVQSVLTGTQPAPWEQAVENLRELRSSVRSLGLYPFFGGYKPFYFLLIDH